MRKVLLQEPVTIFYRNASADAFLTETNSLKKELSAIGNNFNQAVKKLHTFNQIAEFKSWLIAYEVEKKILQNKLDEVRNNIKKMLEIWLQ